jgi:hypothetical protein
MCLGGVLVPHRLPGSRRGVFPILLTGLGRQFVSFLYPSSYSRGVKYFGCGVSSPAVVVTFDPQECVLLDLGEVVPWAGVDEFLFVGGEE